MQRVVEKTYENRAAKRPWTFENTQGMSVVFYHRVIHGLGFFIIIC